jgi:hypothetical protein
MTLHCRFEPVTRRLVTGGPKEQVDRVCPHLSPGLGYLLRQGSGVVAINRMAWSLIDLDIVLDRAADPRALPTSIREEAGAQPFVNFDTHYPLNHGLVCAACRQAWVGRLTYLLVRWFRRG